MTFVRYIDKTRAYYRSQGYDKSYRWAHNESAPFTPLKKPLSQSRVTLISTAGFTLIPEGGLSGEERNALMTGGFATIAGSVLAVYLGILGPEIGPHLLTASVMSAAGQMFITLAHVVLAYGLAAALLSFVRQGLSLRSMTRLSLVGVLVAGFVSFHEVIAADLIRVGFPTRGITAISRIISDGPSYIGQEEGLMDKLAGPLQAAATLRDNPAVFKLATMADRDVYPETVSRTYARLLRVLFDSDMLRFQRRPSTALGLWIIEFGVVGLAMALSLVGVLLWRGIRARKAAQFTVLWASLFLIQVLFIKIQLANPSLWLLAALTWMGAASQSEGSVSHQPSTSDADG